MPPTDMLTYAAVACRIGWVRLVASYVPVRRALSIDPVAALRAE